MSRVIHVTSHVDQGSDDYPGTKDRPVLTFGRAMEVMEAGDALAYDGVLGTMVPEPQQLQQPAPDGSPLRGIAVLLAIWVGCWVAAGLIAYAVWQLWLHPLLALPYGLAVIYGYVRYCKRHGISL